MVVIRLSSRSRPKNNPHFKVVVADQRRSINGKFIEEVGSFNPLQKTITVKLERIEYWVSQGAQMTDRVKQLVKTYKQTTAEA